MVGSVFLRGVRAMKLPSAVEFKGLSRYQYLLSFLQGQIAVSSLGDGLVRSCPPPLTTKLFYA